jgi:hypothetical protein
VTGPADIRVRWRSIVLGHEAGLSWRAKLAGCCLCEHVNKHTGECDPSLETLASRMGVADWKTAAAGVDELKRAGLLEVESRSGRTALYRAVAPLHETEASDGQLLRDTYPSVVRTPPSTPPPAPPSHGDEQENQRTREELAADERAHARELASTGSLGTDELERLLAPLVKRVGGPLTGPGRAAVVRAFADEPAGVAALIGTIAANPHARNPLGVLVERVRAGDHREAAVLERRASARRAPCALCGTGDGRHVVDCPAVTGEAPT